MAKVTFLIFAPKLQGRFVSVKVTDYKVSFRISVVVQ